MERTPSGTPVGVDDPYAHAGVCDHLTGDGNCRYAFDHPAHDPAFAEARRADDFACPVAAGDWDWADCPHFRSRSTDRRCARCGLEERRVAHRDERPLLEEHHLSYAADGRAANRLPQSDAADARVPDHEITVYLCRWCHAKVHNSWARVTDDVNPDPEALAAREERRSRELDEFDFRTAAERYDEE